MRPTLAFLLAAALSACGGAVAGPSPSPTPSPTPQPSPSPAADFYLRAWYTQALPPNVTFNWLPVLTIEGGTAIDGNVAVPAIFPGPLVIVPNARSISEDAIAAIIDEARALGLLGEMTDFTGGGPMPGSRLGQLRIVVDGQAHDLVGNPDALVRCDGGRCAADPGTPAAFAAFWQELSNLEQWLGTELGLPVAYQPERVAILFNTPVRPEPGLQQQLVTWPIEGTFHDVGVEFPGEVGARCVTLSGGDLDAAFPVLRAANQLTVFIDPVDTMRSVVVAVLVPGQDSPCGDVQLD
jgi:hypothetical protein